jgi:hypothetical protein
MKFNFQNIFFHTFGGTADCPHRSRAGTISAVPPGLIFYWIITSTLKRWAIVKSPSGTGSIDVYGQILVAFDRKQLSGGKHTRLTGVLGCLVISTVSTVSSVAAQPKQSHAQSSEFSRH